MEALLNALLNKKLTKEALMAVVATMVDNCEWTHLGKTGAEKKAWVVKQVLKVLEVFDNRLPVFGALLDLPLVDNLEEWAVGQVVELCWAKAQLGMK